MKKDTIPNQVCWKKLVEEMTELFNKIIQKLEVPKDWRKRVTIPIFKKGRGLTKRRRTGQ